MISSRFLLLSSFLFIAGSLPAATITLDSVPEQVRRHNPTLAAARLRVEEARARLLGSGRMSNPELGFDLKHDYRFAEGSIGIGLDQKFPLAARLRLEKAVSEKLVAAAALEVSDAERKLIAEAQTLVVKLLSIEQQRALRKQQTELAAKLSEFVSGRVKAGEISPLDAAQAQVDSQRIFLEGSKLETERISAIGALKPLLGVSAAAELKIGGAMPAIAMPARAAWEKRADYQLSRVNEDAAQSEVELARAKKWEDVSAGLFLEGERMEDAPDGLTRTGFFGLRFSLPLPLWNKNEGEIAEKTAAARRAALETKAIAAEITNEAAAARAEMEASAKLAAETREKLLPLITEQTAKLEKAYESGQTDLVTVLRAREQRLQFEAAMLDATRDFHLARVRYEAATRSAPMPQAITTAQPSSVRSTRAAKPLRPAGK